MITRGMPKSLFNKENIPDDDKRSGEHQRTEEDKGHVV